MALLCYLARGGTLALSLWTKAAVSPSPSPSLPLLLLLLLLLVWLLLLCIPSLSYFAQDAQR